MKVNICLFCKRELPIKEHECVALVKAFFRSNPDITCKELTELVMEKLNNWSCLPAAFAKCIGISLHFMTKRIGHDGSAIVWPGYPGPLDRRGFHIQEILRVVHTLGWSAMPVGLNPQLSNGQGPAIQIEDEFFEYAKTQLGVHLGVGDSGINHAVAYIPTAGFWCSSTKSWLTSFATREIWLLNKCT